MSSIQDINIPAIIEVAKNLGIALERKPEIRTINGIDCLVSNTGNITPLVLLEKYLDRPKRKRATVRLHECDSFIGYVNRHSIEGSTHLFGSASELGGTFTAIIDYHQVERDSDAPKEGAEQKQALPNWGEHVVTLELRTTPEWKRWVENNGRLLPQETFAEFIQDNLDDIVRPDAATILDMAQGLIGRKSVTFGSGKNLKTGAITLEYTEEVVVQNTTNRRADKFDVPDKFTLGIVPFVGANGIEIDARIRFRIGSDGKLAFAYVLNRPYKVIEQAFIATRQKIENETEISVHIGAASITPV